MRAFRWRWPASLHKLHLQTNAFTNSVLVEFFLFCFPMTYIRKCYARGPKPYQHVPFFSLWSSIHSALPLLLWTITFVLFGFCLLRIIVPRTVQMPLPSTFAVPLRLMHNCLFVVIVVVLIVVEDIFCISIFNFHANIFGFANGSNRSKRILFSVFLYRSLCSSSIHHVQKKFHAERRSFFRIACTNGWFFSNFFFSIFYPQRTHIPNGIWKIKISYMRKTNVRTKMAKICYVISSLCRRHRRSTY